MDRPVEPWEAHSKAWDRLGSPFRPLAEDVSRLEQAWRQTLGAEGHGTSVEMLMLGVTPELAEHRWAPEFHLTALDASGSMIRNVWPGDSARRRAVEGNWLDLPFLEACFDLVLTDCGLTALGVPGQVERLGAEVYRVLRPGGRFVFRHLARAAVNLEGGAGVPRRLEDSEGGFHAFKLRFLHALDAESRGGGVLLKEAWERFQAEYSDRDALATRLGVCRAVVDTIDAYRGRDVRYLFPSVSELKRRLPMFELQQGPPGGYPMAESCPVIVGIPRK